MPTAQPRGIWLIEEEPELAPLHPCPHQHMFVCLPLCLIPFPRLWEEASPPGLPSPSPSPASTSTFSIIPAFPRCVHCLWPTGQRAGLEQRRKAPQGWETKRERCSGKGCRQRAGKGTPRRSSVADYRLPLPWVRNPQERGLGPVYRSAPGKAQWKTGAEECLLLACFLLLQLLLMPGGPPHYPPSCSALSHGWHTWDCWGKGKVCSPL